MNNKICKEDTYKNLEIVNSWINNIDLKASFILAFLGLLYGNVLNVKNIETIKTFVSVPINTMNLIEILRIIVVVLLLVSSIFSTILLILTLLARTKINDAPKSNYFFGNIANMDIKEFKKSFNRMNEKKVKNEILNQVYINSKICSYKSKLYNKSINYMLCTIVLVFINYIIN